MFIKLPQTNPLLFPNLTSPVSEDFTESDVTLFAADVFSNMPITDSLLGLANTKAQTFVGELSGVGQALSERRKQQGITQSEIALAIGRTPGRYQALEYGRVIPSLCSGKGQQVSFLMNVRFNYVPFVGVPLLQPQEILDDLIRRCFMMRLFPHSDEFAIYATTEFNELKEAIWAGHALQEPIRSILVNKFHMRLMPEPLNEILTNHNYDYLVSLLRFKLTEWGMSISEMAAWFGVNPSSIEGFLRKPEKFGNVRVHVATLFGCEFEKPKCKKDLDDTKTFFPDALLVKEIKLRLRSLKWSKHKLCEMVGIEQKTLNVILDSLKMDPATMRSPSIRARATLEQICDILRIRLNTIETLPRVTFVFPEDVTQGFHDAVAMARERRLKLRLGFKEVCRMMGLNRSNQTLRLIEQGEINYHNLALVEKYLSIMGIDYDPFINLQPIQCMAIPSTQEFKQLLWRQF